MIKNLIKIFCVCSIFILLVSCDFKDISEDISEVYDLAAKTKCDEDPCKNVANSDGRCFAEGRTGYSCGCNKNYTWKDSKCIADTKTASCSGLPDNASWNTVSTITQTWDGTSWQPDSKAVFNETPSSKNCYFKCNNNYSWDGTRCVGDKRTVNCSGLPENASWNSVSSITQTWDKTDWKPSKNGVCNENSSTSECRFKCDNGYFCNGNKCSNPCKSNPCNGKKYSTGICTAIDGTKYSCSCENTFIWSDGKCQSEIPVDESYATVAPNYKEYFSFRGGGKLYPLSQNASAVENIKVKLSVAEKEIQVPDGYSKTYMYFGQIYNSSDYDGIELDTYIYNPNTGYMQYVIVTTTPSALFDWLKAKNYSKSPLGMDVIVREYSNLELDDNGHVTYYKTCIVGGSDYQPSEYVQDNGEWAVGGFQYNAPNGIGVNKTLNIGLDSKIRSDEAYLVSWWNEGKTEGDEGYATSLSDLCTCVDTVNEQYVDCPN